MLFLPDAGGRWLIAGALGGFHGLSLYLVLAGSGFHPAYVLGGAALSESVVIAALAIPLWIIRRRWPIVHLVKASAGLLLVLGMAWFSLRMWGGV
jgi:hypothetical protein